MVLTASRMSQETLRLGQATRKLTFAAPLPEPDKAIASEVSFVKTHLLKNCSTTLAVIDLCSAVTSLEGPSLNSLPKIGSPYPCCRLRVVPSTVTIWPHVQLGFCLSPMGGKSPRGTSCITLYPPHPGLCLNLLT